MQLRVDYRLSIVSPRLRKIGVAAILFVLLTLGLTGCWPLAGVGSSVSDDTPAADGKLSVSFLNIGQGDSTLIRTPNGSFVLIDGGPPGDDLVGKLRNAGVKSLELVVVTHPHADHIGDIPEVLGEFPVKEVWTNGQEHNTALFERLIDAIDRSGAKFREVKRGHRAEIDQVNLSVLNPRDNLPAGSNDLNNASIVIRMQYGDTHYLFTADAEYEAEADMLRARQDLHAEVLKVGHHGSTSSTSTPFLGAVRPEVAVWSAAKNNDYGHPHKVVLAALKAMGARVYGTAIDGTVTVSTDGHKLWVHTQAGGQTVEIGEAK